MEPRAWLSVVVRWCDQVASRPNDVKNDRSLYFCLQKDFEEELRPLAALDDLEEQGLFVSATSVFVFSNFK